MTVLRDWCASPSATANLPFRSPQANWKAECVERRPLRLEGGKDCKVLPILTAVRVTCGSTRNRGRLFNDAIHALRDRVERTFAWELRVVDRKTDAWSRWLQGVKARRGMNCASVAQANKTARVVWALLAKGDRYRHAA